MRKLFILPIMACAISAYAGVNQYVDKSYLTIVAPASIGVVMTGETTTAVVATSALVSNSVSGVGMSYPGTGALVLGINCGSGGAGVITPYVMSCATSNGAYTVESQVTTRPYTNVNQFVTMAFVPNQSKGWLKVAFTAAGVTNGNVSAVLAVEAK